MWPNEVRKMRSENRVALADVGMMLQFVGVGSNFDFDYYNAAVAMLVCFRAREWEEGSRCCLGVDGGRAGRGIEKVIRGADQRDDHEENAGGTFSRPRVPNLDLHLKLFYI
jgi:hypothetical protein